MRSAGGVLITVSAPDKGGVAEVARQFQSAGFKLWATTGTHEFLAKQGIETETINKMHEGRPHIVDVIKNGDIQLVVNTPTGKLSATDDSYIRKTAIKNQIPYITTLAAAKAAAEGIAAAREGAAETQSLQEYHAQIR